MATLNKKAVGLKTHEGAAAKHISAEKMLRRSVMSCLLWEDEFYEDGLTISDRISRLVPEVAANKVYAMAVSARKDMHLRHVPLLLISCMAQHATHKKYVAKALEKVICRPDELAEFLAIYWADGRRPLAAQVKKGLAKAFHKFDEYQLAKWNKNKAVIKLRDVMRMVHPKPKDEAQAALWGRLLRDELATPNTWEVNLSKKGADKKAVWEKMLNEGSLGGLALIRNLWNMHIAGVDEELVRRSIENITATNILPFRYVAAARMAPMFEASLEKAMFHALEAQPKLKGKTVLLVDVSGSMGWPLSERSAMTRMDAAAGLAVLLRELCEEVRIYTFSRRLVRVPNRRGFALVDAVLRSQSHLATYLGRSLHALHAPRSDKKQAKSFPAQGENDYDRLIVITDEQSHDAVSDPVGCGYMINVGSYTNGVGYGKWLHIDGWSESVVQWIRLVEDEFFV